MQNKSVVSKSCACPKCHSDKTISVKAMNYKETSFLDGYISGGGVGIGMGGLGVGVGGGSVDLTQETKRAREFQEPEPANVNPYYIYGPIVTILIGGALISMGSCSARMVDDGLPPPPTGNSSVDNFNLSITTVSRSVLDNMGYVVVGLGILALLYLFFVSPNREKEEYDRVDKYNRTRYIERKKRFEDLRYCENCASLYDSAGHVADGDWSGFQYLMDLKPEGHNG